MVFFLNFLNFFCLGSQNTVRKNFCTAFSEMDLKLLGKKQESHSKKLSVQRKQKVLFVSIFTGVQSNCDTSYPFELS